jgi:TolB-like protein/Tfp pilus assembly protein PilF
MDALSSIFTWLSDHEAGISAVVGIAVLTGIVLAGLRSLVRRRSETSAKKAPSAASETASAAASAPADLDPLTVPGFEGRPAIAVLPFDNLSGDPDQEYFADGIAEDLITRLSAWRELPVIARNSSFTYKGKAVDVKQVSRELGVRYVMEGSVRKVGDRVRISAQLIDATTGAHVWAETYNRELRDVFEIQDEITQAIVTTMRLEIYHAEWERVTRMSPETLDAWEAAQRATWHFNRMTQEDMATARTLYRRVIELDPQWVWPHQALVMTHYVDIQNQWTDSPENAVEEAVREARRCIELDDQDFMAHLALGIAHLLLGEGVKVLEAFQRATELAPNVPLTHQFLGSALAWFQPDAAITSLERVVELSPRDPYLYMVVGEMARAHFTAGRFEQAVELARRSIRIRPDVAIGHNVLAAALAELDRIPEARGALRDAMQLTPDYTVATAREQLSAIPPDPVERWVAALRKAGLPEA